MGAVILLGRGNCCCKNSHNIKVNRSKQFWAAEVPQCRGVSSCCLLLLSSTRRICHKFVGNGAILYKRTRSPFGSICYYFCTWASAGKGVWVSLDLPDLPAGSHLCALGLLVSEGIEMHCWERVFMISVLEKVSHCWELQAQLCCFLTLCS